MFITDTAVSMRVCTMKTHEQTEYVVWRRPTTDDDFEK